MSRNSVRAAVNVTTDKRYENREWLWPYRENEAMGGYDPCSSKGCAELVTAAYRNSYFNAKSHDQHQLALASARAGNVIGGGDWVTSALGSLAARVVKRGVDILLSLPSKAYAIRYQKYFKDVS